MRILQVISKSEHGGAQSQVEFLTAGLIDRGNEIAVASSTEGPMLVDARRRGAEVHVISGLASSSPLQIARAIRTIRALICSERPDVVHCHSSHAGIATRLAAASLRTPCVFTAHGLPFKRGVPAARRTVAWCAELLLARLPATVVCVNEYERSLARRWLRIPTRRLRVIPTSVPDRPMSRVPHRREDTPVVCTVCRLAPPKRVDTLIRAMTLISEPVSLSVVGKGPAQDDLVDLAQALNVEVTFWGDRDDVAEILEATDLFVICSDHEGAPVSVLEAMRAGLPIVASDLPGMREQLGSGGVFAKNTPESFAKAIEALLGSGDQRAALGAANRSRYAATFTDQVMLSTTFDLYEQLIRSVSPASETNRTSMR